MNLPQGTLATDPPPAPAAGGSGPAGTDARSRTRLPGRTVALLGLAGFACYLLSAGGLQESVHREDGYAAVTSPGGGPAMALLALLWSAAPALAARRPRLALPAGLAALAVPILFPVTWLGLGGARPYWPLLAWAALSLSVWAAVQVDRPAGTAGLAGLLALDVAATAIGSSLLPGATPDPLVPPTTLAGLAAPALLAWWLGRRRPAGTGAAPATWADAGMPLLGRRCRVLPVELALAAAAVALTLVGSIPLLVGSSAGITVTPGVLQVGVLLPFAGALLVAGGAVLAAAWRPLPAVPVAAVALLGVALLHRFDPSVVDGRTRGPVPLLVVVLAYLVARQHRWWPAALVPLAAVTRYLDPGDLPSWVEPSMALSRAMHALGTLGPVLVAWLVGALVAVWQRSERGRRDLAEKAAAEAGRRAAEAERAAIARELHDVVAHHVSMVAVRAETAPYTVGPLEPAARSTLELIAQDARGALDELRTVLGVLRADGTEPELAPQPGLDGIPDLVQQTREAGHPVEFAPPTDPERASPATALACYRIVQEALTNVRRHAPGAAVELRISWDGDRLDLLLRNGSPAAATGVASSADAGPEQRQTADGPGWGLAGMRERARTLGGTLEAGPAPDGGFLVHAVLPR